MSSPTYGTHKTANAQLMEDVTGMLSLGRSDKEPINYRARPDLVRPTSNNLPPPQESVVSADNSAWPESPEQRRARVRAEATARQDDPTFRPAVAPDIDPSARRRQPVDPNARRFERPTNGTEPGARSQRTEVRRRIAEQQQGSPTTRKYLSEPPISYRQPAPTAPADDIGEDEYLKERRGKAAASGGGGGLRKLIPWL